MRIIKKELYRKNEINKLRVTFNIDENRGYGYSIFIEEDGAIRTVPFKREDG